MYKSLQYDETSQLTICMVTIAFFATKTHQLANLCHREDYATSEFSMPLRSFARFDLSALALDFTNSGASTSLRHTAQLEVMMSLLGALCCLGNQWADGEPKIGLAKAPNHPLNNKVFHFWGVSLFFGNTQMMRGNLRKVFIYESMFIYVFQRGDMIAKVFVLIFISTGEMIRFDE